MNCVNYWAKKLRDEGRSPGLRDTMVRFDKECVRWSTMEEELGLISHFGYMGSWQQYRKTLSRDGNPDVSWAGQNLGSWTYAVCIRTMLTDFPQHDWRRSGTAQLNDDTAGDILEAMCGLLLHRRTNGPHKDAIPEQLVSTEQLSAYCEVMTTVVKLFHSFHLHYFVAQEWPDSKQMADMLL